VCVCVCVCVCGGGSVLSVRKQMVLSEINCQAPPTLLVRHIKHHNFMVVIVIRQKYFTSFYPKIILRRYLTVQHGGITLLDILFSLLTSFPIIFY
jgi:hypothetical protein